MVRVWTFNTTHLAIKAEIIYCVFRYLLFEKTKKNSCIELPLTNAYDDNRRFVTPTRKRNVSLQTYFGHFDAE